MLGYGDLHGYQLQTQRFIEEHSSAFCIIDMGLGKTVTALSAVSALLSAGAVKRCLVIAPLCVARNVWAQEAQKWAHLAHMRVSVAVGSAKERVEALGIDADVFVVNRDCVKWLVDRHQANWPFDMVVVDESSSFKSPSSQRFKALKRVRKFIRRVVLLTGTPSPNSLMDLWAQAYLLDSGERLGKAFTRFRDAYFVSDYMGYKWTPREAAGERISNLLSDITISMSAADYLSLPGVVTRDASVQLCDAAAAVYRRMQQQYLCDIDAQTLTASNAAVLCGKLQQLAHGAIYADGGADVVKLHDDKLDVVAELVEAAAEPVVIAYAFRHDLQRLKSKFPHAIDIKASGAIDAWNRGRVGVLLAHPASAGHGLNLQAGGRRIIWFGLTWSLELWQQFNARLHRQGQARPVIVCRVVVSGSIEEDIIAALDSKKVSQAAFVNAIKRRVGYDRL